ncbi:hypothetical protein IQ273_17135 [Nodosilinea sp. LEGE 07298]|jgi:hypothetical protein|uniref:hypothetical protein n=1 Tax=Nodosilinea sp. LEGE 07298 TaxID=2777970 RepID=UPI001880C5D9|nr:hypothetical protein [Nodosilinea sp. LEGE 07298]MBE9111132.1 hypothetical protein [Nodosilinea sp. LEGE 07298]
MARAKRTSTRLQKAERRAAGMGSIKPNLDMGNGMTLNEFWAAIDDMRDRQKKYNEILSTVDQLYNEMIDAEKALAERSERMLNAVAVVYGRNSSEYEMAGGKRRPERRRSRQVAPGQQSVA